MEQLKLKQQQTPKFTIQKINSYNSDIDSDIDSDEEDTKALLELYEYIAYEPSNKEMWEVIDMLEDKLGVDEDDKLKFDSSDSSDTD